MVSGTLVICDSCGASGTPDGSAKSWGTIVNDVIQHYRAAGEKA